MEEVIVILSDSDEDIKPFESLSKKRKIDSDSQDEYEPLSVKKTKKVKTEGTKTIKSEKPKKNRTAAKERKPKATVKSTAKEIKVVKEEIKNEVFIYFSIGKLYIYLELGISSLLFINHCHLRPYILSY